MLPREFIRLYGTPIVESRTFDTADGWVIPANEDRYLLVFWATENQVDIRPGRIQAGGPAAFTLVSGDPPLILSHEQVGSMVNIEWSIWPTVLGIRTTIIQGFLAGEGPAQRLGALHVSSADPTSASGKRSLARTRRR